MKRWCRPRQGVGQTAGHAVLLSVSLIVPLLLGACGDLTYAPRSHIFLVFFGPREYDDVIGSPDAPYINSLATQYATVDQYYAIKHPSVPNYLSLLGGDFFGTDDDCEDCVQSAPTLVDVLDDRGKTWKAYQENLPRPCFLGSENGSYTIHHNPFLYFRGIRSSKQRCNRVVPLEQLAGDLSAGTVPNLSWITPAAGHDMSGTVADGDRWLADFLPAILRSDAYKQNGVVIIAWEEGTTQARCCGVAAGGRVPLLLISAQGGRGQHSAVQTTHYALLRFIEDLWGLKHIGNSGDADDSGLLQLMKVTSLP